MKKFISSIFKFYSYTVGIITPLFIINYIFYKKRMVQPKNNIIEKDIMAILREL